MEGTKTLGILHTYACVCGHTTRHVHMQAHLHARTCTHVHTPRDTCANTPAHMHTCTHMHAHAHTCTHAHTKRHMCKHTCTYAHMCAHTHTEIERDSIPGQGEVMRLHMRCLTVGKQTYPPCIYRSTTSWVCTTEPPLMLTKADITTSCLPVSYQLLSISFKWRQGILFQIAWYI